MATHRRRAVSRVVYVDMRQVGLMQAHMYNVLVRPLPSTSTSKRTHSPLAFMTTWPMRSHSLLVDGRFFDVNGITTYYGFLLVKSTNIFFLTSSSNLKHCMMCCASQDAEFENVNLKVKNLH